MFSLGPTPFDVHFHLLRIPVRVIPTFWLMAAILGWNPDRLDVMFLWIACVFGSIVFHELGHALTAEACGYQTDIVLYHFGGLAMFHPHGDYTPFRQLMISLAGPIPQLIFGIALLIAGPLILVSLNVGEEFRQQYELAWKAYAFLIEINIGWALMNLLPVLPLDGGQSMRAIFQWCGVRDYHGWALKVSVLVGALICAGLFSLRLGSTSILFIILTIQNVQELQARRW